jgi:ankyrin repeat domain-containing protein 50
MACTIDDLNLFASKGIVLYFFCRPGISESLKPRTIIGCLARQLLQQSGDFDNMDELIRETRPVYDSDDLIRMIHRTLSVSTKAYYFVPDGVDECAENEKEEIFRLLKRLQGKSDLLLCVSFRDTVPETMKQVEVFPPIFMGKYAPLRTLPIPAENPDIQDFIDAELEARLESGKLSVSNPAIILEIRDALEGGTQGM